MQTKDLFLSNCEQKSVKVHVSDRSFVPLTDVAYQDADCMISVQVRFVLVTIKGPSKLRSLIV